MGNSKKITKIDTEEKHTFRTVPLGGERGDRGNNHLEKIFLQKSDLFRALIDNLPDFIFIKDRNSRFVIANMAVAKIMDMESPEQLIGKTDFDLHPRELAEKYYKDEQEIMMSGKALINQEYPIIAHRKNNKEIWALNTKVCLRDEHGKVVGLMAVVRDITARKRAQEALQRANDELDKRVKERTAELSHANTMLRKEIQERKQAQELLLQERNLLRTLIDNLPDFVFVKDKNYRFMVSNVSHATALGTRSPDVIIGKTDLDCFPKELATKYYRDDQKVIKSGKGLFNMEEEVLDQMTHERRLLSTTKVPLKNSSKEIIGIVGIARDITKQKQAETQLNDMQKKLVQAEHLASLVTLNAMLAHELNQPLTVIQLMIHDTLEDLKDIKCPNNVIEKLRECLSEVDNAVSIIARYRSYTRLPSPSKSNEVDLRKIGQIIIGVLKESARKANIDLRMKGIQKLPKISGYTGDWEQMFYILMQNAIQAANKRKKNKLIVQGEADKDYVHLQFVDDCRGMRQEHLDKIFTPFFTTKHVGEGSGLGLCIVQRIVSRYSGKIKIESELGKGTKIHISVPIHNQL